MKSTEARLTSQTRFEFICCKHRTFTFSIFCSQSKRNGLLFQLNSRTFDAICYSISFSNLRICLWNFFSDLRFCFALICWFSFCEDSSKSFRSEETAIWIDKLFHISR